MSGHRVQQRNPVVWTHVPKRHGCENAPRTLILGRRATEDHEVDHVFDAPVENEPGQSSGP